MTREQKKQWAIRAGCIVGSVAVTALAMRTNTPEKIIVRSFNVFSKDFSSTVINVMVPDGRGHPGFPVLCLETLQWFKSQRAAAEAMGISRTSLSQHMKGLRPEVSGFHFVYPEAG